MTLPEVAPYESCVSCLVGDVPTALAIRGEAEELMVGLHTVARIPLDQAEAIVLLWAEQEMGCERGYVPSGPHTLPIRLCLRCAERAGVCVGKGEVPLYVNRQGAEGR